MALIQLTAQNFDDTVIHHDLVLVDFWAEWCGPCRIFGEVYKKISVKYPNILFGQVNIEEEKSLAQDFNILSIPTLMVFIREYAVFRESGALTENALEKIIIEAQKIDISTLTK